MRLWRDVPYYAHYVYLIVGCVLLISEFVKRTRQKPQDEWSPEPELLRHQIIGAWYLFAFVVMLFLSGLGLLLVGSLQERIVGGAISVVIGFGYFKLRAIERRKSRMRPSPFFYWL